MKYLIIFIFTLILFLNNASFANAIYDPFSKPNNMHGIHILFPSELSEASAFVNSSNGVWGYVTIPIQIGDRDLDKWQKFMDDCRDKKLIPIIRLATEPYYLDTSVWRKPTKLDAIDFANFLDSLNWPTENRYIIVFNEVNRFDEWGGEPPDPVEYAEVLAFASDAFRRRDDDFYIIMAGMDNAAPNDGVKYLDNLVYIKQMIEAKPEIVDKIDGFSSHSYPNPGFSQPPSATKVEGTATYKYEYDIINKDSDRKIPAFITETGWTTDSLTDVIVAEYYKQAYEEIWELDNNRIVAVTPFLLNSSGGQFENFSFVVNGVKSKAYENTKSIVKNPGQPLETLVKGISTTTEYKRIEKYFAKNLTLNNDSMKNLITEYIRFFF